MTRPLQRVVAVEISEGMARFSSLLLQGYTPGEAAALVGYPDPEFTGKALTRHPQVRKALAEGATASIQCELVPLSLKVARDILTDTNPKAVAVRAKLAVALLDRAAKDHDKEENPTEALAKLSPDKLAELVARGLEAEQREANTIDITPSVTPNDSLVKGDTST